MAGRIPRETSRMGTSPARNHPITCSQGAGDARGQPRTSSKIIVMRQVQGQAGKLIHKSGSREFTDRHQHGCDIGGNSSPTPGLSQGVKPQAWAEVVP